MFLSRGGRGIIFSSHVLLSVSVIRIVFRYHGGRAFRLRIVSPFLFRTFITPKSGIGRLRPYPVRSRFPADSPEIPRTVRDKGKNTFSALSILNRHPNRLQTGALICHHILNRQLLYENSSMRSPRFRCEDNCPGRCVQASTPGRSHGIHRP